MDHLHMESLKILLVFLIFLFLFIRTKPGSYPIIAFYTPTFPGVLTFTICQRISWKENFSKKEAAIEFDVQYSAYKREYAAACSFNGQGDFVLAFVFAVCS